MKIPSTALENTNCFSIGRKQDLVEKDPDWKNGTEESNGRLHEKIIDPAGIPQDCQFRTH